MKILLTADPYLPVPPRLYGGIERIVASLAEGLRKLGHTVGLVAHPDSTEPVAFLAAWPDVLANSALGHVRNTGALLAAARQFTPDVIHSFSRLLYLAPLLPARLPPVSLSPVSPPFRPSPRNRR